MPDDVQKWVLEDTYHVFIGGHGQLGEYMPIRLADPRTGCCDLESEEDLLRLRLIYLSEQLMEKPKAEAEWTIAHEIAHSRLNHEEINTLETETAADELAAEWGFPAPESRSKDFELYQ